MKRTFITRLGAILLIASISIGFASESRAQSIYSNPITGSTPNFDNPYTTGETINPNITVSGIGRGSGITGFSGENRYNASGWSTTTLDITDYFYWTIAPNPDFRIDFLSLVYTAQKSGNGPNSLSLRSSLDGYTANIGSPTVTGTTIDLSQFVVTSSIEFRLYGFGATTSGGTFSVDDFTFNGTVSATPEPATVLLICAGAAGLVGYARRRREETSEPKVGAESEPKT